ncbi:MAG: helix-hairpin-helix domain-containing protein [Actinomycetota bacterium]|nr:helix-hairpin-helix domain-containing protein [Actinomycetota bacterium]
MAGEVGRAGGNDKPVGGWWVLWAILVPLGFGTPAGFLYAGFRSGARRLYTWALMWAVLVAAGVVMAEVGPEDGALDTAGSLFLFAVWMGGIGHAFAARPEYIRRLADRGDVAAARSRLEQRARAKELARSDPELARELGVGRPELPGAQAMGVIDVNHASAEALAQLPGVDAQLAARLVAVREEVGGFRSAPELGAVIDVDAITVERIGRAAVFLPF